MMTILSPVVGGQVGRGGRGSGVGDDSADGSSDNR
jgi:hypothetical protein